MTPDKTTFLHTYLHSHQCEKFENFAENFNMFFERVAFEMKDVVNVGVRPIFFHACKKINHLSLEDI
jgi:hypothetical protein